ncbi:MAG: GspH/FimT family pseudopilin [Methylococcales bacterium]|nr:GspH/FimT family pseudopilin [Methylococcales bacterium]MDD5755315.1 GspH/FimT family pseudopilin [Methylococcales bacterium]
MNVNKGFTLIELLIVIAIISMTMAIGLPSFQSIISSSRLTSTTNAMVSALQLARFEALKQHKSVVIAHKQSGTWQDGWDVFVDLNGDEIPQDSEQLLATTSFDSVNSTITVTPSSNYSRYVTYGANGRINASGHFTFCSGTDYHSVIIATTGRTRTNIVTACE